MIKILANDKVKLHEANNWKREDKVVYIYICINSKTV